jgi:hypothetical protein
LDLVMDVNKDDVGELSNSTFMKMKNKPFIIIYNIEIRKLEELA